jgi:hypothetical protein
MALRVRIAAQALAEVEDALVWMQQRAPAAAEKYGVELRQLLVGKWRTAYRILFTVDSAAGVVNVAHIRHSARDLLQPEEL